MTLAVGGVLAQAQDYRLMGRQVHLLVGLALVTELLVRYAMYVCMCVCVN